MESTTTEKKRRSPKKQQHYYTNEYKNHYNASVQNFMKSKLSSDPGYFAKRLEQRHYEICQVYPLRTGIEIQKLPILILPLRINLIRSAVLGCSQSFNSESMRRIVDEHINIFWKQAGIQFNLIGVEERQCNLGPTIENEIQSFITHRLKRGDDGKMMHKGERRNKFCDTLLASFNYLQETSDTYDIWFIDMVGQQSQGQCIDRKTRTIIMGERSTKGYDTPTKRPHNCIAKTAAHELGHALSLNHPKGMKFDDGRNQILSRHKKNLMEGGSDIKGGGGSYLEQWQCSVARESAQKFLHKHNYFNSRSSEIV